MRFLFVSSELIGSALCHRLINEGHDVKLYIENNDCKQSLEGIVPKTHNWKAELEWVGSDGIVVFDDVGYGNEQDRLRNEGYRVVGGSLGGDKLELQRGYFQSILGELDIPVLPSYDFKNSQAAISFVKENPRPWVVKQNTHFGVLSHVGEAEDGSDVLQTLKNYKSIGLPAHLQMRVTGVEVAVGRFFTGDDWIGPICVNHEHKRLCNDDVGPLTPEMGTVLKFSSDEQKLYSETLAKLKPLLKKINYRGYFDINCIIEDGKVWPLEATARFGTPITELQIEMLQSPLADFLAALADGNSTYEPEFASGYGITVSMAVPPFPFVKKEIDYDNLIPPTAQILFKPTLQEEDFIHIHFEEVARTRTNGSHLTDSYVWAGNNGWVLHVTGKAETIPDAQKKVYSLIDQIMLPMKFYRTDIGNRVHTKDLPQLRKWGLINY